MALSDAKIRHLIKAAKPVALSDGAGLTLTVSANGTAAWILRYRHDGRRRELTLGRYPDVSLKRARLDAAEARVRVQKGADVAIEKQRQKSAAKSAWTLREVVRDYEAKVLPEFAAGTQGNIRAYLERDVLPHFGGWLARDITPDDVHTWLESIARTRTYQAAQNARKVGITIGDHALARRLSKTNPFRAVAMATVAKKPLTRSRQKLDDRELRAFLKAAASMQPEAEGLALRLLLLCGCRANELFNAQWSEIDLKEKRWRIPKERVKSRAGMRKEYFEIPLVDAAVDAFKRLHSLAQGSRWVFRGTSVNDSKPLSYDTHVLRLRAFLKDAEGVPAITHHDLRSTARSHWTALGVRTEVAERMLNHSLGGLIQIYDRGDYLRERRMALEQWAAYLQTLESDDDKVVSLRKGSGASRR